MEFWLFSKLQNLKNLLFSKLNNIRNLMIIEIVLFGKIFEFSELEIFGILQIGSF